MIVAVRVPKQNANMALAELTPVSEQVRVDFATYASHEAVYTFTRFFGNAHGTITRLYHRLRLLICLCLYDNELRNAVPCQVDKRPAPALDTKLVVPPCGESMQTIPDHAYGTERSDGLQSLPHITQVSDGGSFYQGTCLLIRSNPCECYSPWGWNDRNGAIDRGWAKMMLATCPSQNLDGSLLMNYFIIIS